MPDISTPLDHLQPAPLPDPGGPGLQPSHLNFHGFPSGLGCESWPLVYRDAVSRNYVFSNDAGKLINNPLRYSLIAPSAEIASFSTQQQFSKAFTLDAGVLNVMGAALVVEFGGVLSTHATTPGNWTIFSLLGAAQGLINVGPITLLASQSARRWSARGGCTVLTVGASGTVQPTPMAMVLPVATPVLLGTSSASPFDLTAALLVRMFVNGTVAHADNKITMDWANIYVSYPGGTVA